MARSGQAGLWVNAVGVRPAANHTEAEQGYESGMLHQVTAHLPHRSQPFVELEQHGCGESGIRNRWLTPTPPQVALRKMPPVQRAEQRQGALDHRRLCGAPGKTLRVQPERMQIRPTLVAGTKNGLKMAAECLKTG